MQSVDGKGAGCHKGEEEACTEPIDDAGRRSVELGRSIGYGGEGEPLW